MGHTGRIIREGRTLVGGQILSDKEDRKRDIPLMGSQVMMNRAERGAGRW